LSACDVVFTGVRPEACRPSALVAAEGRKAVIRPVQARVVAKAAKVVFRCSWWARRRAIVRPPLTPTHLLCRYAAL
jgi:hypothetical protein